MGVASADGTRIRFYRTERQSASCKDLVVGVVHFLVALVQTFVISVKRVGILHNEFTASHQSETRSCFVSVLGLDLIQIGRKLTIGRNVVSNDIRKDFFVCRSQAELSAVSVL